MAKKLTHYLAPEICDEIVHCMHDVKKDITHSVTKRVTNVVEKAIAKSMETHGVPKHLQGSVEAEDDKTQSTGKKITCSETDSIDTLDVIYLINS